MSSTMKSSDDCETEESLTTLFKMPHREASSDYLLCPASSVDPPAFVSSGASNSLQTASVVPCGVTSPHSSGGTGSSFLQMSPIQSAGPQTVHSPHLPLLPLPNLTRAESHFSTLWRPSTIAPIFYQAPDCISSTPKTPTTHSPIGARTGGAPLLAVSTTSMIRSAAVLSQLTASKRSSGTNALVSDHTSNSPAEEIPGDKPLKPSYFYTPTSPNTASTSVNQFPNSAMETPPTPFNSNTAANGCSCLPIASGKKRAARQKSCRSLDVSDNQSRKFQRYNHFDELKMVYWLLDTQQVNKMFGLKVWKSFEKKKVLPGRRHWALRYHVKNGLAQNLKGDSFKEDLSEEELGIFRQVIRQHEMNSTRQGRYPRAIQHAARLGASLDVERETDPHFINSCEMVLSASGSSTSNTTFITQPKTEQLNDFTENSDDELDDLLLSSESESESDSLIPKAFQPSGKSQLGLTVAATETATINRSDNARTEPSPGPNDSEAAAVSPTATASQPFGKSQLCFSVTATATLTVNSPTEIFTSTMEGAVTRAYLPQQSASIISSASAAANFCFTSKVEQSSKSYSSTNTTDCISIIESEDETHDMLHSDLLSVRGQTIGVPEVSSASAASDSAARATSDVGSSSSSHFRSKMVAGCNQKRARAANEVRSPQTSLSASEAKLHQRTNTSEEEIQLQPSTISASTPVASSKNRLSLTSAQTLLDLNEEAFDNANASLRSTRPRPCWILDSSSEDEQSHCLANRRDSNASDASSIHFSSASNSSSVAITITSKSDGTRGELEENEENGEEVLLIQEQDAKDDEENTTHLSQVFPTTPPTGKTLSMSSRKRAGSDQIKSAQSSQAFRTQLAAAPTGNADCASASRCSTQKQKAQKEFKCSFENCDAKYTKKCNLDRHENAKHKGTKLLTCTQCNRTFNRSDTFNKHKLIHTGVKRHVCRICNHGFARSDQLKSHNEKMHPK